MQQFWISELLKMKLLEFSVNDLKASKVKKWRVVQIRVFN